MHSPLVLVLVHALTNAPSLRIYPSGFSGPPHPHCSKGEAGVQTTGGAAAWGGCHPGGPRGAGGRTASIVTASGREGEEMKGLKSPQQFNRQTGMGDERLEEQFIMHASWGMDSVSSGMEGERSSMSIAARVSCSLSLSLLVLLLFLPLSACVRVPAILPLQH